jgi:hypothetical protein
MQEKFMGLGRLSVRHSQKFVLREDKVFLGAVAVMAFASHLLHRSRRRKKIGFLTVEPRLPLTSRREFVF